MCLSFFANLLNISHLFEYGFLKKPFSLDSFERSRFPTLNLVIINVFYLFGKFLTLNSDNRYVSLCPSVFLFSKLASRRISQSLSHHLQGPRIVAVFWQFFKSLCLRTQQPDHGKLRLVYWLNTYTLHVAETLVKTEIPIKKER